MASQSSALATHSKDLVGEVIGDRFLLVKKIGQGGMAWVFQALDLEREAPMAIKILLPHLAEEAHTVERFLNEGRLQAKLEHPHIVRSFGAMQSQSLSYLVLEWIQGESLRDLLERQPPPYGLSDLWLLMSPILQAVAYAHQHKMIHRDLKPDNFLLQWRGDTPLVKVADFGLAKALDEGASLTNTHTIMGTIRYMSPEQLEDTKRVDHLCDIYSLGVCLYQLAVGRLPFEGSVQTMMQEILLKQPPHPSQANPSISPALEAVILRSMSKSKGERYASCEAFAEALRQLVPEDQPSALAPLQEGEYAVDPIAATLSMPELQESLATFRRRAEQGLADTVGAAELLGQGTTRQLERAAGESTFMLSRPSPATASSALAPTKERVQAPKLFGLALLVLLAGLAAFWAYGPSPQPGKAKGCQEGDERPCYTGPPATRGVGPCRAGAQTCSSGSWGPCQGQVLPVAQELCNGKDDDCDGKTDEAFPQRGQTCKHKRQSCSFRGELRCHRGRLSCSLQANAAPADASQVWLKLERPAERDVQLRLWGQTLRWKGRYCVGFASGAKATQVRLSASGYFPCKFQLGPSSKAISIRLKRRTKIEPFPGYCKR